MNSAPETNISLADLPQGDLFKEMIDAGVFYGRKKSKTNPKMKLYLFGNRGGVEIIDLAKTLEGLESAQSFVKEISRQGGSILFVGTQPASLKIVEVAKELNYPVVPRRWVGGTLTNFKVIKERIQHFQKLSTDLVSGALSKYTKKERLMMEREKNRLQELLGGLEPLERLPAAMIVIDPTLHASAVHEARRMKVPVVALSNMDTDPDKIEYVVAGNTAARPSVEWFLGKLKEAILAGAAERSVVASPKVEK